jgi:hypothetical protein
MLELLERWANLEPERCRPEGGNIFEVLYQGEWYPVSSHHPASHGTLISALLEACQARDYLYSIERVPRGDSDATPQILVGVGMRDAWRSKEGDRLAHLVPELLLSEYLGCVERD